jgi:hypothetical protein
VTVLVAVEAGGGGAESVSKKELRRKRATLGISILVVVVGVVDDALFPRDLHAATGASSCIPLFTCYVRENVQCLMYRRVTKLIITIEKS